MNEYELYDKFCTLKKCSTDQFVSEAFQTSMTTGELDLSGFSVSTRLCEVIECILLKSQNIMKIKLCDCMVPTEGFNCIINALMHHPLITELNFYGNNIQGEVTKKLGSMLAANSKIKILILNWNNIGQSLESFSYFCDGLSKNESLEYLDLRNNQIPSSFGQILSSALVANQHLKIIGTDLRWNKLLSEGVECLQAAVLQNKAIVEIRLKGNFAHSKLISNVEEQTKFNEEMEALKVEYETKIAFLLKEMKRLEEGRFRQVTKITDLAHRKIIEMEKKVEETMDKLLKKEDLLKKGEENRKQMEKCALTEQEQRLEIMEELEIFKKRNLDLKEALRLKESELETYIKTSETSVEREKELKMATNKELIEKEKTINDLREQIKYMNYKWEDRLKEETETLEHLWKSRLKEVQSKLSAEIEEMKIEKDNTEKLLLEEKINEVEYLQKQVETNELQQKALEEQLDIWQRKVNGLKDEISGLKRNVIESSDQLDNLMKELRNEKMKHKKTKEEGKKYCKEIKNLKETIIILKTELCNEKQRVSDMTHKLQEANSRMNQAREEEKMRSELLTSALKRYLAMYDRPPV